MPDATADHGVKLNYEETRICSKTRSKRPLKKSLASGLVL